MGFSLGSRLACSGYSDQILDTHIFSFRFSHSVTLSDEHGIGDRTDYPEVDYVPGTCYPYLYEYLVYVPELFPELCIFGVPG